MMFKIKNLLSCVTYLIYGVDEGYLKLFSARNVSKDCRSNPNQIKEKGCVLQILSIIYIVVFYIVFISFNKIVLMNC